MHRYLTRSNSVGKRPHDGSIDTTKWEIPKRTARPTASFPANPVSTTNRFNVLHADNTSWEPAVLRFQEATTAPRISGRIPPIILEPKMDWTHEFIKTLIKRYTNKFHLQYRGNNKIAIICYSPEGHEAVKKGLKLENVPYHTFSRKDERTSKAVIYGLPEYVEDYLKDELASLGFSDVFVRKLKMPGNRKPICPPFMVQLPPGSDIKRFRQIKYISNCVVEIKKYQARNLFGTQCFRCQGFGHSSKNCNLTPRCVKCTESHLTSQCTKKDRTQLAQCCNCNENHPANYRNCKERQKYLQLIQQRKEQIQSAKTTSEFLESRKIDTRPSNELTAPRGLKTISGHTEEVNLNQDQTTSDMLAILMTIKTIKSQFVACDNMMDKVILILTHLGQYV